MRTQRCLVFGVALVLRTAADGHEQPKKKDPAKPAPKVERIVANLLERLDTNKDGKVDRKEFEAYFRQEALKKEKEKKPPENKEP